MAYCEAFPGKTEGTKELSYETAVLKWKPHAKTTLWMISSFSICKNDLLQALLVFFETHTWTKRGCASSANSLLQDDMDKDDPNIAEVKGALEVISTHFRISLEAKGLSFVTLQDEIEEMVEYARKYLDICVVEYRKIWYKLFCCPDSHKWPNILVLCELAFCLLFSNGQVEQIFSSMKILKTDQKTNMNIDSLNDVMENYVESPPLSSFSPDNAIQLLCHTKACKATTT